MQPFMMSPRAQTPLPGQVLALPSGGHHVFFSLFTKHVEGPTERRSQQKAVNRGLTGLLLNAARGDRRGKGRLKGEATSGLACRRKILC